MKRPAYDKFWRCPGWWGPGWKCAQWRKQTCDGGSLASVIDHGSRWWQWRTHHCPTCGVLVLPYAVRFVDPTHWWHSATHWTIRRWR